VSTTLQTLVDRTRNFLRDTPDYDQTTVSLANSTAATTITVADTSPYRVRWAIEVDYETMILRSAPSSGTTMTVTRGWRGAAVASHAASASVLIRPAFYAQEIIDAINGAIGACYPYLYYPVVDTSLTVLTNQYQYAIPSMPGTTGYPIPMVYKVEVLQPGDYTFRETRRWEVQRGVVTSGSPSTSGSISYVSPVIKFRALPPVGGTLRVHGFGPFPQLVNLTDSLDPLFPPNAAGLLHKIAAGYLLQSGEAGRDRSDSGPIDRREEANRGGLSLSAAGGILGRTELELLRNAMPPLPRHIKSVI
jgi:hypothetical protein